MEPYGFIYMTRLRQALISEPSLISCWVEIWANRGLLRASREV